MWAVELQLDRLDGLRRRSEISRRRGEAGMVPTNFRTAFCGLTVGSDGGGIVATGRRSAAVTNRPLSTHARNVLSAIGTPHDLASLSEYRCFVDIDLGLPRFLDNSTPTSSDTGGSMGIFGTSGVFGIFGKHSQPGPRNW